MPFSFNPITGKLDLVNSGTVTSVTATSPLFSSGGATPNITIQQANATEAGFLSATDWITFNNKLSPSSSNYITNPDAEVNTTGWNLYNDSGNTKAATVIAQDITYTAVASGNAGNGINIDYIFHPTQSYLTPLVTVVNPTLITVAWYNGPTIANNPTATQLKAAFDAVPGAVALATSAITGVASNRQYETGSNITANGGDTAPVDGTGGIPSGVTFTRNTSTPLAGVASFDLGKIAANEQGQGVSTDFIINAIDINKTLQINFAYEGSSGMVLGSSSDVRVFVYDITNATLIPVTSTGASLPGPVSVPKTFSGQFASSSSVNYRLIVHIATTSAVAWDLLLDNVTVNSELNAVTATQVPSLVLLAQPISGSVTDHMVVMWQDGASQWVPATIAGAALPVFGDDKTQLGFATNIIGSLASIYIRGAMDGFSFGPFVGFEQYIDNVAGGISPLPSPFNDMYVMVGMAISSTILNIQFDTHVDLIANGSGIPIKGGLLTSSAVNDGTGDVVLSPGANNTFLVANSAVAKGLNYRALVSADIPNNAANTTGSAATLTTARTIAGTSFNGSANIALSNKFIVQGTTDAGLSGAQFLGALATGIVKNTTTTGILTIAVAGDFPTLNQSTTGSAASFTGSLVGDVTGTQGATVISAATVTGKLITGFAVGANTALAATDTILGAFDKVQGQINARAPLASPVFTGDVNVSTGNLLVSTIGKGLQVKTGTNAKIGTAVLAAGTVTVANTSVTANSRIFLTVQSLGTVAVATAIAVTAKVVGTSFTITSASVTDTSTIAWMIVESIP